ncbi:iron hydrogenase [Pterulicium gracile]|uniref:Iron hydrogenase n=1 Tax=Pterulicium gracile TaxID=1884261 RepID=A0A5C3QSK6_9AGAR|nr:iron hydrogenase [Pterula gracilis]
MAFSGALTLTDLNDFITPSQTCIKPVEELNKPEEKEAGGAETEIQIDASGMYYEVPAPGAEKDPAAAPAEVDLITPIKKETGKKLVQAEVSLADCLACSGCITSAESVLITLQSHTEVFNYLEENSGKDDPDTCVVSVAPQSLASIAASLTARQASTSPKETPKTITPRQVLHRVRHFLSSVVGFDYVFDTTFARHLALMEHVAEYQERRRVHEDAHNKRARRGGFPSEGAGLPMLASSCPGWVCYAEKAHPEMLPFIAQTKSPQQVMGSVVKNWMGEKWGKRPNQIYHVTVMPCYDKKLEASRSDFYNDVYSTREVDCVITTGELERMMLEKDYDVTAPVPGEKDLPQNSRPVAGLPNGDPSLRKIDEHQRTGASPENGVSSSCDSHRQQPANGIEAHQSHFHSQAHAHHGVNGLTPGCGSNGDHTHANGVNHSHHHTSGSDSSLHRGKTCTKSCTSCKPSHSPTVTTTQTLPSLPSLLTHSGSSSGSFLHALLIHHLSLSSSPLTLTRRIIRNADYEEFILADAKTGAVVFRGAKCYGFRNLQNVVRKVGRETGVNVGRGAAGRLKNGTSQVEGTDKAKAAGGIRARVAARKQKKLAEAANGNGGSSGAAESAAVVAGREGYDYIEVMACPGGCVNGGGQLKPPLLSLPEASPSDTSAVAVDDDGHTRNWNEGGAMEVGETEEVTMAESVLQNAKWGDKEWVKKVESTYWEDGAEGEGSSASESDGSAETSSLRLPSAAPGEVSFLLEPIHHRDREALRQASELAQRVIDESVQSGIERKVLLRTQYHAVESEVIGLAVKW